jgi:hypothetical protein
MRPLFLTLVSFGFLAASAIPALANEPSHNIKAAVYTTAATDQVAVTPVRWYGYRGPRYYGYQHYYYGPYRANYYGYVRPYWNRAYYYPGWDGYNYPGWNGYYYPHVGFRFYGPRAGFSFGF